MFFSFLSLIKANEELDCYINIIDGCPKCISRSGSKCGYCAPLGVCDSGDERGPEKENCDVGWIYPQDTCTNDMCLYSSKTKKGCKNPCVWNNRYSKCLLPRNMSQVSVQEQNVSDKATITTRLIYASLILFAVFLVGLYAYGTYYNRRPLYSQLAPIADGISLDDLPHA